MLMSPDDLIVGIVPGCPNQAIHGEPVIGDIDVLRAPDRVLAEVVHRGEEFPLVLSHLHALELLRRLLPPQAPGQEAGGDQGDPEENR
jgi:hypothetical protein